MVATTRPNESKKKNNYKNEFDDMDEYTPNNRAKVYKSKESTKTKLPPDLPLDKYEAIKRIERDKRAMHKKLMDEEYSKRDFPMKYKKTAKTNWTKYYEKGAIDEMF